MFDDIHIYATNKQYFFNDWNWLERNIKRKKLRVQGELRIHAYIFYVRIFKIALFKQNFFLYQIFSLYTSFPFTRKSTRLMVTIDEFKK